MIRILFREATKAEFDEIAQWVDSTFGTGIFSQLIKGYKLIVGEGNWREYFRVSPELFQVFSKICAYRMPYSLGVYLARYFKNHYELSLESLRFIAPLTDKKVWVSEEGERFFLYGKDIFKRSVTKISPTACAGDKVIVLNSKCEALGLGVLRIKPESFRDTKDNTIVVDNITDLGWYIRKAG
ncbi:MAG: hypothetical protein ACTSSJ_06315 [Candidatus Odinarchaeia archaeon]